MEEITDDDINDEIDEIRCLMDFKNKDELKFLRKQIQELRKNKKGVQHN